MTRLALWFEFLALFGAGPLLVVVVKQRLVFLLLLWVGAVFAWHRTHHHRQPPLTADAVRTEMRSILRRFMAVALVLGFGTWLMMPEGFLTFPLERPWLWLAVMVGYPLLSVWPQEMLYRRFVQLRYAPLFGPCWGFVAASGLAFGYAHLIFVNPIAIVLSTAGGLLFATNFLRHRSLMLVWVEHSLYGCLIFTIGLGRFFLTWAAWHP